MSLLHLHGIVYLFKFFSSIFWPNVSFLTFNSSPLDIFIMPRLKSQKVSSISGLSFSSINLNCIYNITSARLSNSVIHTLAKRENGIKHLDPKYTIKFSSSCWPPLLYLQSMCSGCHWGYQPTNMPAIDWLELEENIFSIFSLLNPKLFI